MKSHTRKQGCIICPNPLTTSPSGDMGMADVHGLALEQTVQNESSIDYPASSELCEDVWEKAAGTYAIKPEIRQKALELVDKLLAKYKVEAKGVNVVGSICSNQYTDDCDVDIHVLVDLPANVAEKLNNLRKLGQEDVFKGDDLTVGGLHQLEFYFQPNKFIDIGSCGCYDLMNNTWLSGPQLVALEFDPYEEYEESWNEAFQMGIEVQTALFDLNKNLYKYNAILEQATNRDIYSDESMMAVVGRRLENVKEEIWRCMGVVAQLKERLVQVRRRAQMNPMNEIQAEEMRTNKEWLTANSTFKFLQRLKVIDQCWLVAALHDSVQNGDVGIDSSISELNRS